MLSLRSSFLAFMLCVLIWPAVAQAHSGENSPTSRATSFLLHLLNGNRAEYDLGKLVITPKLSALALSHSQDMADHGYFSHYTPAGESPFDRMAQSSVHYRWAGENLGWALGGSLHSRLRSIDDAMMLSPDHRTNILMPSYHKIGIGMVIRRGAVYVTEDFTN